MSREASLERLVGQVLAARYRIGEQLGAGAMGTVFRAEHVKVGRTLAVKVLHPRMLESAKYRRRFEREAELAGKLRHPNVAGVMDVGITPEGLHYLVMEYAEGPTLAELLDAGPMAAPRILDLVKQLCEGLHHAHEHGLIHRDFKPDNVIVERDRYGTETPRILDFGIAIALEDTLGTTERERLTTAGLVLGTPHYMAPEHASGQAIDHRIDLFALGVIAYEMMTGVLPFDGDGVEIARSYLSRPIPPMLVRAPSVEIDPLLEAFTRALLVRSRDARLPSAKAARDLLMLIESDRPAAAGVLGVQLPEERRTVPVSSPPPPARGQRSLTAPPPPAASAAPPRPSTAPYRPSTAPPAVWNELPTESMPPVPVPVPVPVPMGSLEALTPPPVDLTTAGTPPHGLPVIAEVLREPAPAPDADADAEPSRRRRLGWILVGALGTLAIVAGILALTRGDGDEPPRVDEVASAPPAPAPPSAPEVNAPPIVQPAVEPIAEPAPPPVAAPPAPVSAAAPPAPSLPARPRPAAKLRPSAPSKPSTPASSATLPPAGDLEDPPTDALVELYAAIGRLLKQLDDTRGQEATLDLWPRYRTIHIYDALGARDRRIAALSTLRFLEHEIAARSR